MPDRGILQGVAAGLDPRPAADVGVVAQVGPLVAFVIYVGLVVLMALHVFPDPAAIQVLLGVLGPVVGAWARHLGSA